MRQLILLFFISIFLFLCCNTSEHINNQGGRVSTATVLTNQTISPVLIGKEVNPVLRIKVEGETEREISDFYISTEGTSKLTDIDEIQLFYTGSDSVFNADTKLNQVAKISQQVALSADQKLRDGASYFWISYKINSKADLLNRVDATLQKMTLKNGKTLTPVNKSSNKRLKLGIALRQRGEDSVHTFRIPGLVTTNNGTLIAAYDIRYENSGDLQGNIDVGISRSTDGGQSWEPMKIIMDMDEWGGKPENQNGVGDAAVLVDRKTNTIWVAALWAHGHEGERILNATRPGFNPEKSGQLLLVKSEDNGKTWSEPANITKQVKKEEWHIVFNGPGKGISMKDGTLVFPAQFWDEHGMPFSTIIYSKDHGKTWEIGTGAKSNTTEAQVVELSDGSLMLNMRDNRGGARSVYTTDDLGTTWQKHPTSRSALKEPVCMASLIHFPYLDTETGKHCLLFSNPNNTETRKHMTIKMSTDDGMTWPDENQLLLNENRGYGYSCMTPIGEEAVGILYEGVRELYFQKVKVHDLLGE